MAAKPLQTTFNMKENSIRILSTRPIDEALIEKAALHNIELEAISFIDINKQVSGETLQQIEQLAKQKVTVVFTSMNAVDILIDILPDKSNMPDWNIYCMGGTTFTLVKKYWHYKCISATAKDSAELAQRLLNDNITEVHFFCGNKRREELPSLLQNKGINVNELVIYETIEIPVKITKSYKAIVFFSPSAVHSFFQQNQLPDSTILFAIGNTTAKTIRQFCSNEIVISDFPAKNQLVERAIEMMADV